MGLLANQPSLEDQIRQRWGKYGDWNAAGLDQVAAFAKLLRENGITDLDQLDIKAREYSLPDTVEEMEIGPQTVRGRSGTAFDVFYGGEQRGFLGDINRDGSITTNKPEYWDELARNEDGTFTSRLGTRASSNLRGDGNLLGWSAQGGGNTSFYIAQGPDGKPVVVPVWGSSRQEDYQTARGIASVLLAAGGAQLAAAGGGAGQIGQGMLQGQGMAVGGNVLFNPDGDVDSMAKSSIGGSISGGIGAGAKVLGSNMGWNPSVTKAGTSAVLTAARGGDAEDILRSGAASGFSDYAKTGGFTGYDTVDRAIGGAGSALIAGKSGQDALISAVNSALSSGGARNNADASRGGDALDQDMPEGGGGGGDMGDEIEFDGISFTISPNYQWLSTSLMQEGGYDAGTDLTLSPDTRGDENGYTSLVQIGGGGDPVKGFLNSNEGYGDTLTSQQISIIDEAAKNSGDETDFKGWAAAFMKAMGLSGRDLLGLTAAGLSTLYKANKSAEVNGQNNEFTLLRDKNTQEWRTKERIEEQGWKTEENDKTRLFNADENNKTRDWNDKSREDTQLFTREENQKGLDWKDKDREDTQDFDFRKIRDGRAYEERMWRQNQGRMANAGTGGKYSFVPRRGLLG